METKTCLNCSVEFNTQDKRRKFCSLSCAAIERSKGRRRVLYHIKCCCGKEVDVKDKRQRFCSRSCSASVNGKIRRHSEETKHKISESLKGRCVGFSAGKEKSPRQCAFCKNDFLPEKTSRKYCCVKCSLVGRGRKERGKISYRTFQKMLKRAFPNWKCPFCEWNGTYNVHHIHGKQDSRLMSMIMICPNHHALAHKGAISTHDLEQYAIGKFFSEEDFLKMFYGGKSEYFDINIDRKNVKSKYGSVDVFSKMSELI